VAGSPLSGAHRLAGICESTGIYRTIVLPPGECLSALVRPVLEADRSAGGGGQTNEGARHDLTLAEALGTLGFEAPQVRIRSASGSVLAVFDPLSGVITPLTRPAGSREARLGHTLRVTTRRGPVREGRRPVIGSLAPLSFGSWQGDTVELVDPGGNTWRLHPGHLEDLELQVAAWFDGPVPAIVASWLIARSRITEDEPTRVDP
jgi:hypothetical protein